MHINAIVTDGNKVMLYAFNKEHPASHYGLGVFVDHHGKLLDGATLTTWYEFFGFRLLTWDLDQAAGALGLDRNHPALLHWNSAAAGKYNLILHTVRALAEAERITSL